MANPKNRNDANGLARGTRQLLEGFELAGVRTMPRPAAWSTDTAANTTAKARAERTEPTNMAPQSKEKKAARTKTASLPIFRGPSLPLAQRTEALATLQSEVEQCTACTELAETRNKTVFGVGSPEARLCLLGEAPGANEDKQGEPFVGRAGQLLDKILEACTLSRQDVYILNVIKCRPPGNRNPASEEVTNCRSFFERQLDIIQPEFICCLGSVAAQNLLDTTESIGRLRGRLHDWNGIQVLATYHPAYLLRNPSAKAEVWKDMQFLMGEMGIALPKRKPK